MMAMWTLAHWMRVLSCPCFYAVSALPACRGMSASKHSGVRSLFEKHFIKDGPLPGPWGRFFHQMLNLRPEGDYGGFTTFVKEDVAAWLDQAKGFVTQVDRFMAIRDS